MANLLDEYTKEELRALAAKLREKVKRKNQSKADGEFCAWCQNFSPMAEPNFDPLFLCYSCNLHVNRVILGLEEPEV